MAESPGAVAVSLRAQVSERVGVQVLALLLALALERVAPEPDEQRGVPQASRARVSLLEPELVLARELARAALRVGLSLRRGVH